MVDLHGGSRFSVCNVRSSNVARSGGSEISKVAVWQTDAKWTANSTRA
jgi:hypothetical protein